jgi:hypothetical protein
MLFMVIERFKPENREAMGERFKTKGRMLPESVIYHASWMETNGASCYQVMEAPSRDLVDLWIARWSDLVEFEVVPVLTSAEYWRR